jgi:hypothetical protein
MKHVRFLAIGLLALALAALVAGPAAAQVAPPLEFEAELAGPDVEIDIERAVGHYVVIERSAGHYLDPEAETQATGTAYFRWSPAGLQYRVMVRDLARPTEISLRHVVERGGEVQSEIIAVLWTGSRSSLHGRLAGGRLQDDELRGPLADLGVLGLLREVRAGNIYVVVSTQQYPRGEIGGPLLPVLSPWMKR